MSNTPETLDPGNSASSSVLARDCACARLGLNRSRIGKTEVDAKYVVGAGVDGGIQHSVDAVQIPYCNEEGVAGVVTRLIFIEQTVRAQAFGKDVRVIDADVRC